jgi:molybdopterin-binding protein
MVALITRDSADELGLALGQQVTALIKATDVMLMNDESAPSPTVGMIGG